MSMDGKTFTQTLVKERDTIVRFIELLKREQDSLRHGRTDDLQELAAHKDEAAVVLENLVAKRRSLLSAYGLGTDRKGTEAWCSEHPEEPDATATWLEILDLAAKARELQRVNGELIELHLHYNAKALEVLQGEKRSLDLYGPDGQAKSSSKQSINHLA